MPCPPPERASALAEALRPAWLSVDLDALRANLGWLSQRTGGAARMAVVKANAYGHGAVEVSRALTAAGVEWLSVAMLEEAVELRRAGLESPILVFGALRPAQLPLVRKYRVTPSVVSLEQLAMWREAAPSLGPVELHLKVDTGMTRLGIDIKEMGEALAILRGAQLLRLTGLMSHFADADDLTSVRTADQERRFDDLVGALDPSLRVGLLTHLANSGGVLHRPPGPRGLVRLGLSLYGVDPARQIRDLVPVLSLAAEITLVREVPAGTRVGYGGRWTAARPSRLAIVPVGYADGYPWRLGAGSEALVAGQRVPLAGSVSMDMLAVDVTGTGATVGDPVVLLGCQGEATISVVELADRVGTIPYEILCLLGLRLPRRYLTAGRCLAECSPLLPGGGR